MSCCIMSPHHFFDHPGLRRPLTSAVIILFMKVIENVANWDTTPVFVKATGDLSQLRWSPVCNSNVFTLFEQNMMFSVENFLNHSYARFASTTTTTTAH